VTIQALSVSGLDTLPADLRAESRLALDTTIKVGDRFEEEQFVAGEKALAKALGDRGYAFATVKRSAEVDLAHDRAHIAYDVTPGPRAKFGAVTIQGLGEIPEDKIRRALMIDAGDPYSTAELESAQAALLELGVFSSVRIEPTLDRAARENRVVPVRVIVEPSRLRALRFGVGAELDALKADAHLLAGWEDRNFLGGLRQFTVEVKPGIVFYPTRINDLRAPTNFLPEEKTRVELRQPGFFEPRTNGLVRGEYNIFPVLLSEHIDETAPIIGYHEIRGSLGLDRTFKQRLYVSPSQNVQANRPFAYAGLLDPDLGPILVSYPELFATLDFRDDAVAPHKGIYLGNDLQYAGLGGDARDFKVRSEVRGYLPLTKRMTVALRATGGLMFPQNYGTSVKSNAEGIIPPPEVTRAGWVRDTQIGLLRGFFSGGPASNRGYALRAVGPHGTIPFYVPGLSGPEIAQQCDPSSPDFNIATCELPLGGFTLWEASAELRFPLSGPLDGVTFCDASDVSPSEVDFRFDRPHLSCGPGLRLGTPVGPVRLDLGYRIPALQTLGDASGEGTPSTTFGLPIAVSIGVEEAF
jgi:outer membrane protein assembly factor BamA